MKNNSKNYLKLVYNFLVFIIISGLLDKAQSLIIRLIFSAVIVISATFFVDELKNIIKNFRK